MSSDARQKNNVRLISEYDGLCYKLFWVIHASPQRQFETR